MRLSSHNVYPYIHHAILKRNPCDRVYTDMFNLPHVHVHSGAAIYAHRHRGDPRSYSIIRAVLLRGGIDFFFLVTQ